MRTLSTRVMLGVMAAAVWTHPPEATYAAWDVPMEPFLAALSTLFAGSAALVRHDRTAPALVGTVVLIGWAVTELFASGHTPMRALFVSLASVTIVATLWTPSRIRKHESTQPDEARRVVLLIPLGLSLAFAVQAALGEAPAGPQSLLALAVLYGVGPVLMLRGIGPCTKLDLSLLRTALVLSALPALDAIASLLGADVSFSSVAVLSPVLAGLAVRPRMALPTPVKSGSLADLLFARPSRVLVVSFLALCIAGTLVLRLPSASTAGLSWLDAAFTATSAVCVTGLIVVDTPNALGGVGQAALLVLIQLGGLGIMALSAAAMALLGRRLPVSYERAAADIIGVEGRARIVPTIRLILATTFITEGISASLLLAGFLARGEALASAAWRAVFTSVSAFCNAGFALQSDSLVPYADSPYVLTVVGVTIIVGGLGPVAVVAIAPWRSPRKRSLQVRLILWTSVLLLLIPAGFIALLEWNSTLGNLDPIDRLFNAAFQSITLRTAGFNSIDLSQVRPATWTIMLLCMFIGGSPGSTAGGIKTTTFAVLALLVVAVVRRTEQVSLFGRRISRSSIRRATATVAVAALGVVLALLSLLLTQDIALDVTVFEVVSALATVGLSTGGTGALDDVGKVIIILCMFSGRVGSLTLFLFLSRSIGVRFEPTLPEEAVATG